MAGAIAVAIAGVALVVSVDLTRSDERSDRVRTAQPTTAAPTTTAPTATFPDFLPAPGWQTVTTPSAASATAANIPLGPDTLKGYAPWDTVACLADGDIVLFAMIYPTGESTVVDANFPTHELPLSLDDSVTDINDSFRGAAGPHLCRPNRSPGQRLGHRRAHLLRRR